MAYIKVTLDKEKGMIKMEHDDLTPMETMKVLLSASQNMIAIVKAKAKEISKIIKPDAGTINKLKQIN